ncbi:protein FAM124B [Rhinophrynus dorsalis]
MDESHNVLPLTVHLLTSSGDSFALQQAIDQILHKICPDVRLFLVSEQAAPAKRYESQKKRLEFPGISVTLFLREDLGDERISLLQGFFHSPPWNHISIDLQRERYSFFNQPDGDFYSLDLHMPVWGIRQVHYGAEIVRLTLYCSCDNYEDAVRLYETILQKEAMVQKIGFCLFVVHSTKHTAVQLSLKQLHPGVSVQVKDSCALQFLVHEIGQLVPLLPYPCVPISDTRWQTQDYDGNKILLLVISSALEL